MVPSADKGPCKRRWHERWITKEWGIEETKIFFKNKSIVNNITTVNSDNRFSVLSDDNADSDDEDDIGHDLEWEILREICECEKTMHFLQEKTEYLE